MGIMEVDAQGNLWPVEHMEAPNSPPSGQVTQNQVFQAQAQAAELARRYAAQRQAQQGQLPGVVPPTAVPPQDAATGPGWVTLTDQALNDQLQTDRQARSNQF